VIKHTLTIGPPISKNKMYAPSLKYGMVKTKFYRKWLELNLPLVKNGFPKIENFPIEVEIMVVEGSGFHDRSDIDNVNKAICDILVKSEIIPDDNIKYIIRCEERFMPGWSKKSEAITQITIIEPDGV
jgi:Holliday junction resolvase RusA-like endonuclease